ncbi:MAG: ATP-binding protein [Pseudonocardiales bacterium]|nr:ATP-binding protein [Pseudonocardiales bacterium]
MTAPVLDGRRPRRRLSPLRPARGTAGADRTTLARLFTVSATVLAVLGLLTFVLGGVALSGLTDARSVLLDRVAPALDAGQRLSVSLLDQETGVRGFSLTASEEFLAPYVAGGRSEEQAVRALAASDIANVGPDLQAVEAAAQRWRTTYAEPAIAAARAGAPAPDAEAGRALFNEVRAATDGLVRTLLQEQAAARGAVTAAAGFLLVSAIAAAVVLVVVFVTAATGLRRTVLRPVSELAAQVRAVVEGDPTAKVAVDGPRELVQLGEDVEAMRVRILRDLDASHEANRLLDEQARELERSNRDLEQFAYVASHDLQEPLRKVSSFCQLLQRRYGGQLDDRADQYIGFAVDGAQRMQQLINDLLSFSRVGRTTEGFAPVPLGDVVASAVGQLETLRAEAEGEIVVADDLPVVLGDPALLRQLFVNVVGNGLKFRRDGVPPVIRVAAERDDEEWVVTVTDNGIGIDEEYAEKVFVIFQRLHARDVYPGTGIGLALSKKIAEFHGGRIRLDRPDGPGTVVRITLPVPSTPVPERATA